MKSNRYFLLIVVGSLFFAGAKFQAQTQSEFGSLIKKLVDGNKRYASSKMIHPDQTSARRTELKNEQHPFAVVLSCSDSRVPPEVIFDQGIGDLFVIRVAGNVLDDAAIGSIEYAVEHLNVKLIVVLGHERCGAVSAAVKGGEAPGHLRYLVEAIQPAVEKAKSLSGDIVENAVRINVQNVVAQLKSSEPIIEEFVHEKKVDVVGARYDLDDGLVTFLK
ncbi:MAG: carbonic anhydrase [Bacteroidetes bacterium]|nr:carbonic anhydrase [Bacteroidota bacterium]